MSDDTTDTPEDETAEGGATGTDDALDAWSSKRDTPDAAEPAAEADDAKADDEAAPAAGTAAKAKGKGGKEQDAADDEAKPSDDERAARKAKADAVIAERQVARRTVTSRRVTPKGGASATPSTPSKARDAKKTEEVVSRAPVVTAKQVYDKGPSPWWVPTIMFGLLIVGALIIMTNYMGVFGDASNIRLVIGLGFILGGIIAATQYR